MRSPEVNLIIQDSESKLSLAELWQYRELLYFLTWRDIKVRYKQTVLGVLWVIIQPVLIALMFSLFFGRFIQAPSSEIPYVVFVYVAMVPWQFFASTLIETSNSVVANERLVTKVFFPRLVIPLSAVFGGLVDFAIALTVMIPFLTYYRLPLTSTAAAIPLLVLFAALATFAIGLWLAALNVQYRDVRYTLGFLVQVWFLVSPIAYSSKVVPQPWRTWYGLNPMVGVIEGFRWAVLGGQPFPAEIVGMSIAVTAVILAGGLAYFRKMEDTFADIL